MYVYVSLVISNLWSAYQRHFKLKVSVAVYCYICLKVVILKSHLECKPYYYMLSHGAHIDITSLILACNIPWSQFFFFLPVIFCTINKMSKWSHVDFSSSLSVFLPVCGCDLAHSGFFQKSGEYICTADYQRLYGTKCDSCGDFISGEVVSALGRTYHPQCFVCSVCRWALYTNY